MDLMGAAEFHQEKRIEFGEPNIAPTVMVTVMYRLFTRHTITEDCLVA
jgi:hypothetical protein